MKAVVLAGGGGTRLWPLSRRAWPKQFLKIGNKLSLFQGTLKRLLRFLPPEDIVIVTGRDYEFIVHWEINELSLKSLPHIILEPFSRGTAPAIALSLKYLLEKQELSSSELVFVAPSDHIIEPEEELARVIGIARKHASLGKILTFGIKPYKPETGYGYIGVLREAEPSIYEVEGFFEKPSLEKAREFLSSGRYFWNSGMFLFRVDSMINELKKHAPRIGEALDFSFKEMVDCFSYMPDISIDYAVMEKTENLLMVSLNAFWSDVGSYDAIYDLLNKDEDGNAVQGEVINFSSRNSLILGDKRLIVTLGIEDMLIVETEDAILVSKRGESQKVREVVRLLKERLRKEADERVTVCRPWGMYTLLEKGDNFWIKRVVLNPREGLTFQRHRFRSEHWIVVKGEAKITFEDREVFLKEGESIFVPQNEFHKLENPSDFPLEIVEVACGSYLGEDDIERREGDGA
ncbi:MAG: mannose-1-phosphate guanylyltransferase/mannose-6-phosphate isomerase [Synergistetes bacterium]|nr:mannose-1-phosphate guanylyltransferase/mannose-6-phosphate isomerase [Synergistota bacterium]MDW8192895.1 mannose-1-phosphate guanylyltransferase/mannose-6-phosphate isomerase [Synergistota bacterium]